MGVEVNFRKEIVNLSKGLPHGQLREIIDFARFLRAKKEGFTYMQVIDSVEYIKKLRAEEGGKIKSGRKFIRELIEWQKSNF